MMGLSPEPKNDSAKSSPEVFRGKAQVGDAQLTAASPTFNMKEFVKACQGDELPSICFSGQPCFPSPAQWLPACSTLEEISQMATANAAFISNQAEFYFATFPTLAPRNQPQMAQPISQPQPRPISQPRSLDQHFREKMKHCSWRPQLELYGDSETPQRASQLPTTTTSDSRHAAQARLDAEFGKAYSRGSVYDGERGTLPAIAYCGQPGACSGWDGRVSEEAWSIGTRVEQSPPMMAYQGILPTALHSTPLLRSPWNGSLPGSTADQASCPSRLTTAHEVIRPTPSMGLARLSLHCPEDEEHAKYTPFKHCTSLSDRLGELGDLWDPSPDQAEESAEPHRTGSLDANLPSPRTLPNMLSRSAQHPKRFPCALPIPFYSTNGPGLPA